MIARLTYNWFPIDLKDVLGHSNSIKKSPNAH